MHDCLIIGGGVIGLSLAYDLALHGLRVCLVDRQQPGREASWAGAGILPPMRYRSGDPPAHQLAAVSFDLHARWAAELRESTGIDNGFRRCGAIYITRDESAEDESTATGKQDRTSKQERIGAMQRSGVRVEPLAPSDLNQHEPNLTVNVTSDVTSALFVPEQAQVRNPRHLKALRVACESRGVDIRPYVAVEDFEVCGGRIESVITSQGRLAAGQFCLTAGCWTGGLAQRLGLTPTIKPIRGQIALLTGGENILRHIIEVGRNYLVPRPDGHILVGSTEEDVGFNCQTTAEGIAGLLRLALQLVPKLAGCHVERTWAGLRPGSTDSLPTIGPLPRLENAWIAAGHFRDGLLLSPGTAVVVSRLMRDVSAEVNLEPFQADRDSR